MNIQNKKLKYHLNGARNIVAMNGKPNAYTPLMHALNTFLNMYWVDHLQGYAYWAMDPFLYNDVVETINKFIHYCNKPEDNITIEMLSFIKGLRSAPKHYAIRGGFEYEGAVTFYEDGDDTFCRGPRYSFNKIMELLKVQSRQQMAAKKFAEDGLVYGFIREY